MDRQRVILVVDDDRSVRKSTLRLLAARGYTAVEAENAQQALDRALEIVPDAILMDLQMAQTSGLDAARRLKALERLQNIPIIALSATPPAHSAALQLFARMLLKPCPSKDIIAAIESVLSRP